MKPLSISLWGLFFALFCFSNPTFAQQQDLAAPVGPMTTIEFSEPEFDFGEIEQGEVVSHVFNFTNTGKNSLIISNAKGSCGCTVPQWPRDPIAPGETASIVVQFDSKGKRNKQNKKVTLTANTDPSQNFIYLKGSVLALEEGQTATDFKAEMPEEPAPDCFMIYPNPTAEILQLDLSENAGRTAIISIYAKDGQLMAKREIEEAGETEVFNVSHYPAGTYIANVNIAGAKSLSKCFVVVEN